MLTKSLSSRTAASWREDSTRLCCPEVGCMRTCGSCSSGDRRKPPKTASPRPRHSDKHLAPLLKANSEGNKIDPSAQPYVALVLRFGASSGERERPLEKHLLGEINVWPVCSGCGFVMGPSQGLTMEPGEHSNKTFCSGLEKRKKHSAWMSNCLPRSFILSRPLPAHYTAGQPQG